MNFQDHKSALLEIKNICLILPDEIYAKPLNILTGSSIGQHIRHIIEFYHCLLSQANKSVVNYDLRKRNSLIEKSGLSSAQFIEKIGLHSVDQKHILHDDFGIAPSTLMYRKSNVHS